MKFITDYYFSFRFDDHQVSETSEIVISILKSDYSRILPRKLKFPLAG